MAPKRKYGHSNLDKFESNKHKAKLAKKNDYEDLSLENAYSIITLNDKGKKYIRSCSIGDFDPAFIIHFNDANVADILAGVAQNQIQNLPAIRPAYIFTDTMTHFKSGIIEHLREVGGGASGNIVAPNNLKQYEDVLTRLAHMELEPYVQRLVGYVNGPIGRCVRITDRGICNPDALNRIVPPPPYIVAFK